MRKLLILLFKLYLFHLCYCDDDPCYDEPKKIYLLKTNQNANLTELFTESVRTIMDAPVEYINVNGKTLKQALASVPSYSDEVAIYFQVTDFYQHNYNEIKEAKFRFAGDMNCQNESIDMSDGTKETYNLAQINMTPELCEGSTERQTKLVSKSIDNYPRLLDFVNSFVYGDHYDEAEKECKPLVIVVCIDIFCLNFDHIQLFPQQTRYIRHKTVQIDTTLYSCSSYNFLSNDRIIAVLAPRPFEMNEKMDIFTIFYDQLEMDANPDTRDKFENGHFFVVDPKEKIASAFLKVMQMSKWERVGIVSDDSEHSKEIERELTTLFDTENVIYTSIFGPYENCDYTEVLRPIMMADPRIIIANIEEKYANEFSKQAARWQGNSIVWLVRWSPDVVRTNVEKLGDVVSITLRLSPTENSNHELECSLHQLLRSIENFEENNFLDIISKGGKTLDHDLKLLDQVNITAYIAWYRRDYYPPYYSDINKIASTKIEFPYRDSNPDRVYTWEPRIPEIPSELSECTFKSSVYLHPCNDVEYMLILLCSSVFALTILGIIYFFQMPEGPYTRMTP